MKAITLISIALATSLPFNFANADEATSMDVVVVTAARPVTLEMQQEIAVEKLTPVMDFSELSIEAPRLDPSQFRLVPARLDVALGTEVESKS